MSTLDRNQRRCQETRRRDLRAVYSAYEAGLDLNRLQFVKYLVASGRLQK